VIAKSFEHFYFVSRLLQGIKGLSYFFLMFYGAFPLSFDRKVVSLQNGNN